MGKGKKIIIGAAILLVVMIAVWQISNVMTSAQPLTAEEATQKVQELYAGDIVNVKEGTDLYFITIELETGTYEIEIDRESGDIGSMTRTKQGVASNEGTQKEPSTEQTENPSNPSQEEPTQSQENQESPPAADSSSKANPEVPKQLTEKEAIEIALKQLNGEVDDVEIEESNGQTYYMVEIEREGEEAEATIRINAISGEVMSVIWED
jgi:uncharacterized membrane protein YkoI